MEATYLPRIVDAEIKQSLAALGAVAIEGPRGCGKTEAARQQAASELLFDLESDIAQRLTLVPASVLEGPTPRLLDEWQLAPRVWDYVRREVDVRRAPGQFILTGSARPAPHARRHSGAGRFALIRMRPLSLWEVNRPAQFVSIAALFSNAPQENISSSPMDFDGYLDAILRGGWPGNLTSSLDNALAANRGYVQLIVESDISELTAENLDPERVRRFLHAYAQVVAHPARIQTIVDRAVAEDGSDALSRHTVAGPYLDAVRRLMVVDEIPAWQPSVRSGIRLTGTPKRHLVDPSLAAVLLDIDRGRILADLQTLGFLFESLATRDLQIYAQACRASCAHYRQRDGRGEIDVVLEERGSGKWVGFEIKLGSEPDMIERAAQELVRVASAVAQPPAALVVVTTGSYAYRRPEDDVYVIPLSSLGP